jgi:hypothetical protein
MPTEPLLYSVTATLPDEAAAEEYAQWLRDGHVEEVVAAGRARWGRVFRMIDPPEPVRVESQYLFESAADFEKYVADHANRLRNEGLLKFPTARGFRYERRLSRLVTDHPRAD